MVFTISSYIILTKLTILYSGASCTAENDDAAAAYGQALLYYFTDNSVYLNNAIKILDAWATTLKNHTGPNAGKRNFFLCILVCRF
jgi:hypothetical protein